MEEKHMSVSVSELLDVCVRSGMHMHMMQKHAKLGFFFEGGGWWGGDSHAGDTAPHACAHGVFDIACGYKADEYQNNHDDDGCGVTFFLFGWAFASRLRPMRKKQEKDLLI